MKPLAITLLIMFGLIGAGKYTCNKMYYALYNVVKDEFNKIEGVEILQIYGNEDLTLEDIYATIKIPTGDTLTFAGLDKQSFDSSQFLACWAVNQWKFNSTECRGGYSVFGNSLSLAEWSEYPAIRNLHLRNISDVIKHIGALKKIIDGMAEQPRFDTLTVGGQRVYFQKYNARQISYFSLPSLPACR